MALPTPDSKRTDATTTLAATVLISAPDFTWEARISCRTRESVALRRSYKRERRIFIAFALFYMSNSRRELSSETAAEDAE